MRLSTDESDPGYTAWVLSRRNWPMTRVYLDGAEVSDVITADDVQGFVLHHPRDAEGQLFLVPDEFGADTQIARERLEGRVVIELSDR